MAGNTRFKMYTEKNLIMPGVKLNAFVYKCHRGRRWSGLLCLHMDISQGSTTNNAPSWVIFSCFLPPLLSKYCSAKHTLLLLIVSWLCFVQVCYYLACTTPTWGPSVPIPNITATFPTKFFCRLNLRWPML